MPLRRLLLLIPLVCVAAAPPPVPVYRQFGRWLVACDNARSCVARGFDEVTRAELDVVRAAGAAGPGLTLSAEDPIDPGSVKLDGKTLDFPAPAWSMANGSVSTDDPQAVQAFIAAARNGHVITLDAAPAKDDQPRTVPLDGMMAALLLVDAVQGRPGTPAPLVAAKGDAAAPPAPPLPKAPAWIAPPALTRAETQRLKRRASQLVSPEFDPCTVHDAPEVYALDEGRALAIRPCYMAAYQGSSVVAVLARRGEVDKPVTLPLPGLPGHATDGPDMVDPSFDPATGTLQTVAKGRGLADCGISESWVWSGGAFRLTGLSYQDQCGGTEPGDWPVLFRVGTLTGAARGRQN